MKHKYAIDATLVILSEGYLSSSSRALHRLLGLSVKLSIISLEIDSETGEGKESEKVVVKLQGGCTSSGSGSGDSSTTVISLSVPVSAGFGKPGAICIDSRDPNEFFLKSVSLRLPHHPGNNDINTPDDVVYFPCYSCINHNRYNSGRPRFFFSNELCLPSATPPALRKIRRDELLIVRGDSNGERQLAERKYEYAVYNDLCDLDSDPDQKRPILGGSAEFPCPRRVRTGRASTKADPTYETHMTTYNKTYVPRDERFSPLKKELFMTAGARSFAHSIVSDMARLWRNDKSFHSLDQINSLYKGHLKKKLDHPPITISEIPYLVFPPPGVVQDNVEGWKTDEEFARQRLAGTNPHVIRRLTEFPPVSTLDPSIYGPPESAITRSHLEPYLEGYSVEEALEKNLVYIVDYYDMYMPYLKRINEDGKRATYAPRVIFYLSKAGTLLPIAIELSLPPKIQGQLEAHKRVFTPNRELDFDWLWHFAKAHFSTVDTTYQLSVSHWLRTHASMEPIVMASRRHLSTLHPLHALLAPHFKDTINTNSEGRIALVNAEGRIEKNFAAGKYSMEMVCQEYKKWRFDEQALPADLLSRGIVAEDASAESGVRLLLEDYPYAEDGLDLWTAIRRWAADYLGIYYGSDEAVAADEEVQNWWAEIKEVGHGDHATAEWWPQMNGVEALVQAAATIMWLGSGFHASVNFGNYAYSGYVPNSPGMTRRFIPEPDAPEMADTQKLYMEMMPSQGVATITMATFEALGHHVEEEEYLGERPDGKWTADPRALAAWEAFKGRVRAAEAAIAGRNAAASASKGRHHRAGPARLPYTLLSPTSTPGLTFRGVPNSISM